MKNLNLMITGLATALCLIFASTAIAKPGGHCGDSYHNGPGWSNPQVQLTDEQKAQFDQTCAKHRAAVEPIMQQLIAERAKLDALMVAENPDPAKVESIAKEIGNSEAKLLSERSKFYNELNQQGLPRHHSGMGYGHKGPGHGGWHRERNFDAPCSRW